MKMILSRILRKLRKSKFARKSNTDTVVPKTWEIAGDTWDEVNALCTGYGTDEILNKCKESLYQVKTGQAVYERDSVLFDSKQYSTGLLVGLLLACKNNNTLNVLDFGGSLGTTYFQNRDILEGVHINWVIVEQPEFVKIGREYFQTDNLKFCMSVQEALLSFKPDVIVLSGVLQCINLPGIYEELINVGARYILVDRTSFNKKGQKAIVKQNVPEYIYKANYPMHVFEKNEFLSKFETYENLMEFPSYCEPPEFYINNDVIIEWLGFVFKKK